MLDKHKKRPVQLENMSYVQFVQRCEVTKAVPKEYLCNKNYFKKEMKVGLSVKNKKLKNYIIGEKEPRIGDTGITLPKYFPLDCGRQWMRLRRPLVIRFHKFKFKENPHEFYYAEMQKYLPFRDEENELGLDSLSECKEMYDKNSDKIIKVRETLLKYLKSVEIARERAEDIISEGIGNTLDGNKEQEEDECEEEGVQEHPELFLKDPSGLNFETNCEVNQSNIYRKIELEENEDLNIKAQRLDVDQSIVLEIGVEYSKSIVKAIKTNTERPQAPLVIIHGGAGTGKSTVIDVLSQNLERILRNSGDDPNHPYIIRAAFTGNAALIIRGQTLHSAFNFPYGNEVFSLSDKMRDQRRKIVTKSKGCDNR
jgi:hypothetical protein